MRKFLPWIFGIMVGILNGFFGAGGGVLLVPMLKKLGVKDKSAHATSIAIIFPLCLLSASIYIFNGVKIDTNTLGWLIPFGLIGAVIGALLLRKINPIWLNRIFCLLMIASSIKLFLG